MNENDTYVQLHTLEKKLQLLEENNNIIQEQMKTKKNEQEFGESKAAALTLLNDYNKLLQRKYSQRP